MAACSSVGSLLFSQWHTKCASYHPLCLRSDKITSIRRGNYMTSEILPSEETRTFTEETVAGVTMNDTAVGAKEGDVVLLLLLDSECYLIPFL